MAEIFRKSSLEKLSSPEQLDKMIVITSPTLWLSLAGAAGIVIAALLWGIFGRLPTEVDSYGIYVNRAGVQSVYAKSSGTVSEILVTEGSAVKRGDIIALLDSKEIDDMLWEYEERIAAVEAVTMDSENDVYTPDNKSLMDVKNQMITLYSALNQDQALLEYKTEELGVKRLEAAESEQAYLAVETEYFNSLYVGDSTQEQLDYSQAQAAFSTAGSYLESANGSLSQAELAYAQALSQYNAAKNNYEKLQAAKAAQESIYREKETTLNTILAACNYSGAVTPETVSVMDFEKIVKDGTGSDDIGTIKALQLAAEEYIKAYQSYQGFMTESAMAAEQQYQQSMEQQRLAQEAAAEARDRAQSTAESYSAQKDAAGSAYDAARQNYIAKVQALGRAQAKQSELANRYNMALSQYNTDWSAVMNLEDAVSQLEVQIAIDQQNIDNQLEVITKQFYATKGSILSQLKNEYEQYRQQRKQMEISASADGVISNISVTQGSVLGVGSEVAKIQMGDDSDSIVVCYIPIGAGKKIQEGMEVMVCPSTVKKEEYGHMKAYVVSVDDYITSTEDMLKQLGDNNLVESFLQNGPVVEVVCELERSEDTASGYYWSSKKGASVVIDAGTMVEVSVVTEEKAPITMLIPYLKEKLTVKAQEE